MKVCAAQLRPISGDIAGNVEKHLELVALAADAGAKLVFFPELSLTGYEPRAAAELAIGPDDHRLDVFQAVSDARGVIIGVGLPWRIPTGVRIGMAFFQPARPRLMYAKQLLHSDELPFFVCGDRQVVLEAGGLTFAPAICYESLQPDHAVRAASAGANVYLASVAKSAAGVTKGYSHYPVVAARHAMTVLMANCLGPCDDFVAAGRSAVWNSRGDRFAELDDRTEGIVTFDTDTQEAHAVPLSLDRTPVSPPIP
ncbi:carbon-nitrogen hydrolase family protein [Limnoglobus roseus]|uniref:CN hydrolase domain-containing protein n=1 Tax=Limnoglobus roseus TaxID=2598579 RepID=A0A5C1AG06_9BACT|nr:carbon-nitrogen hydrolase family protein [Limnoglobus roseus]QEL15918.1 hypothetical protein PX52LOC_02854 [Limnoglobus roseus]